MCMHTKCISLDWEAFYSLTGCGALITRDYPSYLCHDQVQNFLTWHGSINSFNMYHAHVHVHVQHMYKVKGLDTLKGEQKR